MISAHFVWPAILWTWPGQQDLKCQSTNPFKPNPEVGEIPSCFKSESRRASQEGPEWNQWPQGKCNLQKGNQNLFLFLNYSNVML